MSNSNSTEEENKAYIVIIEIFDIPLLLFSQLFFQFFSNSVDRDCLQLLEVHKASKFQHLDLLDSILQLLDLCSVLKNVRKISEVTDVLVKTF